MSAPNPVPTGTAAVIAKIAGWAQFILTLGGQIVSEGIPTNALGWVRVLGSLALGIGMHAAGSTDGTK